MRLRTERATGTVEVQDAEVDFQQLTPDEVKSIRQKHTRYHKNRVMPEFNENGFSRDLWQKQVVGWRNVCDASGNEIPCDVAGKNRVFDYDNNFVAEVFEEIGEYIEKRKEILEKN